jgi:hypothetical protein
MRGAREVVAKALALECMRGAHRQQRACYLYAFSGPGAARGAAVGSARARAAGCATVEWCPGKEEGRPPWLDAKHGRKPQGGSDVVLLRHRCASAALAALPCLTHCPVASRRRRRGRRRRRRRYPPLGCF